MRSPRGFLSVLVAVLALGAHPASAGDQVPTGRIVFISDRDGDYEIFRMRADGTRIRKLTDNEVSEHSPSWSPAGRFIAFVRGGDIWLMHKDGTRQRRITRTRDISEEQPIWSPDGRWLSYSWDTSDGSDLIACRVWSWNDCFMIAAQDMNSSNTYPAWSSDSSQVAFVEYWEDGDIFVRDLLADSSPRRQLTHDYATEIYLSWSPTSDEILFSRDLSETALWEDPRSGSFDLWTVDPTTAEETRLTWSDELDELAGDWSPDGRWIVFNISNGEESDLYVMESDWALPPVRLTDMRGYESNADWVAAGP